MKIKLSPLVKGLSGKLGNIVFRQCGDKVVASSRPTRSKRTLSPGQQANRTKFLDAVQYANQQVKNPLSKTEYEARITASKVSAHAVAMADFFHAPKVEFIDSSGYHGAAGELIVIKATDDFRVISVQVAIKWNGRMIEEGEAVQQGSTDYWHYTSKIANPELSTTKVCVAAMDKPGNVTTAENVLSHCTL